MTARNEADRPGRILYSVQEAAELLGVGRTFMFYLVATGEIESLKIGKLRKIPRDAIETYVDKLRSAEAAIRSSHASPPGT